MNAMKYMTSCGYTAYSEYLFMYNFYLFAIYLTKTSACLPIEFRTEGQLENSEIRGRPRQLVVPLFAVVSWILSGETK